MAELTPEQIKKWVASFDYDDSLVKDVQRKYLAHYVNIARVEGGDKAGQTDTANPKWEILGYKVEDASIDYNWDSEALTDILGVSHESVTKSEPELSLDGYIVHKGSEFLKQMTSIAIRNAYDEFSDFEILTVFYWMTREVDTKTVYLAKRETGCTIKPESLGGEGYVRINPVIRLSNNATFGSVAEGLGTAGASGPTFKEGTAG